MKLSETMKESLVRLLDAQESGTARVATKKDRTVAALARRGLVAYGTVAFGTSYAVTLTADGVSEAERLRAEDAAEDAEPEPVHMRNMGGTLCGQPGPDTAGTGHVDCEDCQELLADEADRHARGVSLCPVWDVATDECDCSGCEDLHADAQADRDTTTHGTDEADQVTDCGKAIAPAMFRDSSRRKVNCPNCLREDAAPQLATPKKKTFGSPEFARAALTAALAYDQAEAPALPVRPSGRNAIAEAGKRVRSRSSAVARIRYARGSEVIAVTLYDADGRYYFRARMVGEEGTDAVRAFRTQADRATFVSAYTHTKREGRWSVTS